MAGRDVVPLPLSGEVGKNGGVDPAHPVVGVRPAYAVRNVLVGLLGRVGRVRGGHGAHRTPRRAAAVVAAIGLVALSLSSLHSPATASAADEKVTFTVGITNEVDSFNPFLGIEAESYEMWALTYDYMITYSMADMSPEPGLATDWTTSDDGLTWTFNIREGVTWSDGEPLTAADIAFTYNLSLIHI